MLFRVNLAYNNNKQPNYNIISVSLNLALTSMPEKFKIMTFMPYVFYDLSLFYCFTYLWATYSLKPYTYTYYIDNIYVVEFQLIFVTITTYLYYIMLQ